MPIQARVQVSHKRHKRLPNSNELGAQYVSPHQRTKRKEYHTCKTCACLIQMSWHDAMTLQKLLQWQKRSFWLFRTISRWERNRSLGSLGRPEPREFSKKVQNSKASCCTLLKRITRLKCVNSEVRTVNIHPEKGCLQWLHGTMSEPPWKSH